MDGLRDGTIDSISSDHRPFASEKKSREFDQVPFGVSSIETALAVWPRFWWMGDSLTGQIFYDC